MVKEQESNIDNRVKITNGKVQLVQKIKGKPDPLGLRSNKEIEIDIQNNVGTVLSAIKLFENFYKIKDVEPLKLIVQHKNYI